LVAATPTSPAPALGATITTAQESPEPALTHLTQSASTWRVGTRLASATRSTTPPVGTKFSFDLNVPATALFIFTRREAGRTVGGKCVRPTTRNRSKPRCQRFIPAGRLTIRAHAGTNKVRFEGRVSPTRKLKPGRHSLTVFATDGQGRNSFPSTLRFKVVGP
jgi:hypothetical protein